jgi:heme exporter protein D
MNGVLNGGWAFVWAAYAVSALVIFGYAARTFVQNRGAR